jgi:hypothetical protein
MRMPGRGGSTKGPAIWADRNHTVWAPEGVRRNIVSGISDVSLASMLSEASYFRMVIQTAVRNRK